MSKLRQIGANILAIDAALITFAAVKMILNRDAFADTKATVFADAHNQTCRLMSWNEGHFGNGLRILAPIVQNRVTAANRHRKRANQQLILLRYRHRLIRLEHKPLARLLLHQRLHRLWNLAREFVRQCHGSFCLGGRLRGFCGGVGLLSSSGGIWLALVILASRRLFRILQLFAFLLSFGAIALAHILVLLHGTLHRAETRQTLPIGNRIVHATVFAIPCCARHVVRRRRLDCGCGCYWRVIV
mmetsp:Transcript_18839/g.30001  ORF Transcript_18839/g.30001 Transcript_18839/m.30001 type:complete len:244 (-) Transcript_18839:184-915(-)